MCTNKQDIFTIKFISFDLSILYFFNIAFLLRLFLNVPKLISSWSVMTAHYLDLPGSMHRLNDVEGS